MVWVISTSGWTTSYFSRPILFCNFTALIDCTVGNQAIRFAASRRAHQLPRPNSFSGSHPERQVDHWLIEVVVRSQGQTINRHLCHYSQTFLYGKPGATPSLWSLNYSNMHTYCAVTSLSISTLNWTMFHLTRRSGPPPT